MRPAVSFSGTPKSKWLGGIGGGQASEILIEVFPEFLEALALPEMELAKSLGTTVRA